MEGLSLTDKKGNRIGIDENYHVTITPNGSGTHVFTFEEIINILNDFLSKKENEYLGTNVVGATMTDK